MKKLWIFGDSFSTSRDSNTVTWTNLLAAKLNAELKITAKGGSSLGWMMYKSFLSKNEFQKDDYIIFQTTTLGRALLDKNRPGLAEHWKDCPDWSSLTAKEQQGYKFHMEKIHDEEILFQQLQMWAWAIDHYISHIDNKPVIAYAWDIGKLDLPQGWLDSSGALLDLSMAEFSGSYDESIDWMLDNAGDPRDNHFSTTNHYIIADLFYDALTKRIPPNFNNLRKKIYNKYPKIGKESWSKDWIL
jgi:hypothetical protein